MQIMSRMARRFPFAQAACAAPAKLGSVECRSRQSAISNPLCRVALALLVCAGLTFDAAAQDFQSLFDGGSDGAGAEPTFRADLHPDEAAPGDVVTLKLTLDLPKDGYTYSMRKSAELAGMPTSLEVEQAHGLTPVDEEFQPDPPPKRTYEPLFKKDVEKFTGSVTWSRT